MHDVPPWMKRQRRQVTMMMQTWAKVLEVADAHGVPFSTALDALVRLAPESEVAKVLEQDAGTIASWRLHGESS